MRACVVYIEFCCACEHVSCEQALTTCWEDKVTSLAIEELLSNKAYKWQENGDGQGP